MTQSLTPPPKRAPRNHRWKAVAERLRQSPRMWVLVDEHGKGHTRKSQQGGDISTLLPEDGYELIQRLNPSRADYSVWGCYDPDKILQDPEAREEIRRSRAIRRQARNRAYLARRGTREPDGQAAVEGSQNG